MAYSRPPITEALVELRYRDQVSQQQVETAADKLKSNFFYDEIEQAIGVAQEKNNTNIHIDWQGRKLSSLDRADILIFRRSGFVSSRLAPYDGWDEFKKRAMEAWTIWRRTGGTTDVARVGLRYVNRIDIPIANDGLIESEDYLTLAPKGLESLLQPMTGFALSTVRAVGADDCHVMVNIATLPSPLVNHVSFGLDIDVFSETNIPRHEDRLWELLDRMRMHKNEIFEACITDKARELFKK